MTPDQKFARWIKYSCTLFILLFAYFLFADITMPLTPQAMATRVVTKVSPRVSGQISHVYVQNNQQVTEGDILFEIDPRPYELAVEKAMLDLKRAVQNNEQLDASILAAKADVDANNIVVQQKQREAKRLETLFSRSGTSQQLRDDAHSDAIAAVAKLQSSQAKLRELQLSRGEHSDENLAIKLAKNQLEQAQLNLSYTKVIAESSGTVTNLQLDRGAFAISGSPLIALVSNHVDLIADFREKSLRDYSEQSSAYVAFDSQPGQIFSATINSVDAGVSSGQFDANGRLATPTTSNRWVRDAQRLRLHLNLDQPLDKTLPSGARATVQLLPSSPFMAWLAKQQIAFISALHYIY